MTAAMSDSSTPSNPDGGLRSNYRIALGAVACLSYAVHAIWHIASGTAWDALWICHLAALMIGLGMILGAPRLNAAGFLCSVLGLPSWLLYLLSGEPLIPTSLLTHVAAPLVGLLGIRSMGLPKGAAWLAIAIVVLLTLICTRLTPAEANVNLAHGPIEGLSLWRVKGSAHLLLLFAQWIAGLMAAEIAARSIIRRVA